jgi:hypothetical protein
MFLLLLLLLLFPMIGGPHTLNAWALQKFRLRESHRLDTEQAQHYAEQFASTSGDRSHACRGGGLKRPE